MIRITSKREGFRRCGMGHSKQPVEYPDDRFSDAELEILRSEPMLTVEVAAEPEKEKPKGKPPAARRTAEEIDKSMTVPQLADALKAAGVEIPSGALKADLVALYVQTVLGR